MLSMGERTTMSLNTKNRASLKTTVPMFIVNQWNLKAGEEVEWALDVCKDGELVATVRKTVPHRKSKYKK